MPRLEITGTERRYNTVAAIEDNGAWQMVMPFPRASIRAAALVGDERLICLSEDGELCLIAWRSRRDVVRRRCRAGIPVPVGCSSRAMPS